ncbi:MAG: hypothetical protein Q8R00_00080 [Candidatus Nanoarchaeia archaeon]|nr:hypothetical protein [Candidatus Nanoarchaeia archaeon]
MIPEVSDTTLEDWAKTMSEVLRYFKESGSRDLRCVLLRKDNLIRIAKGFVVDETGNPCEGFVERPLSSDFELNFYQPDGKLIEGDYLGTLLRHSDDFWHFLGYNTKRKLELEHQVGLRLRYINAISPDSIYLINQLSENEGIITSHNINNLIIKDFTQNLETVVEC